MSGLGLEVKDSRIVVSSQIWYLPGDVGVRQMLAVLVAERFEG